MERSLGIKPASDKPPQPHFTFPISLSKPISPSANVSKYGRVVTRPARRRRSRKGSIMRRSHLPERHFICGIREQEGAGASAAAMTGPKRLPALFRTPRNYRRLVRGGEKHGSYAG